MKAEQITTVTTVLTLELDEVKWLSDLVQNPKDDKTVEDPKDREMRLKFWAVLHPPKAG